MLAAPVTVNEFMKDFSHGVTSTSPVGALLIVAGFFLVFYIYRHYTGRMRRDLRANRERLSQRLFEKQCRRLALQPSEKELMTDLSKYLPDPKVQQHWLFDREAWFNRAFHEMLDDRPGLAHRLMAMKVRLGFIEKTAGKIIRTTVEIPVGAELFLRRRHDRVGKPVLRVVEVMPAHFEAELLVDRLPGGRLSFYFIRPEGIYSFRSTPLSKKEELIHLRHSELLYRKQLRRYFRHPVSLPVDLQGCAAETIDLGGGGASINLLEGSVEEFVEGEAYEFRLDFSETRRIHAAARIVAIHDGQIRLQFTKIRESDRDVIINHLFASKRAEVA